MLDHTDFDLVFSPAAQFPYHRKTIQDIEAYRKSFNGSLFIDRVLKALGLNKAKTYPPKSENALRTLHQHLCEADISLHHRLSIFYYFLLDFDGQDSRSQISDEFADVSGVPKTYQIFMKGLWLLDHQQFELALEHVTHPSLTPDFSDEILITFVKHSPPNDLTLPLSYYHTVQPTLKTQEALELLFNAIARTSVTEALYFSRTYPDVVREQLFQRLVASVLEAPASDETADRALELVGLSLEPLEETWLEDFLSQGEGKRLRNAKDTLLMRKITTGKYEEAIKERGGSSKWGVVLEGLKVGLGGRTE